MNRASPKQPGLVARMSAELGIIVLGVLIALWADGWVAERADREVERNRIEALRDNLDATRARLTDAAEEARAAQEALESIAYWRDVTTVGQQQELVLFGLLFGPVFTPETNVYADLKNSGDLGLLTSPELRQALAHMDAVLEQLALLQSDLTMVQQLNFDPFVVRAFDLGQTMGPFLGLEELPSAGPAPELDMRLLRNLALFKLDLVIQLGNQYEKVAAALDAVERAMDDALDPSAVHP
jgi:hypothetical protein